MSEQKDTVFYIRVEKSLGDQVRAEAAVRGHHVSGFIRWVLRQWCDANAVTLEQARHLADAAETEEATDA